MIFQASNTPSASPSWLGLGDVTLYKYTYTPMFKYTCIHEHVSMYASVAVSCGGTCFSLYKRKDQCWYIVSKMCIYVYLFILVKYVYLFIYLNTYM